MMPQLRRFLIRVSSCFRREKAEQELNREVAVHLALIEDDYRRRGMTAEDARLAARRTFGGVEYAKELHRDARAFVWLDHLRQDGQYAFRTVARNPGFTLVAVLTLALGIGANTAMFSVVNAVILRPLPYRDADRLVRVSESNPGVGRLTASVSQPNFLDWRTRARAFSALAAAQGTTLTMTSGQSAEMARGASVTAEFLPVLGVPPAVGRNFLPDENRPGGDSHVVILGDGFWKRAFASDPSILGRQIVFGGARYTVVGVLPSSFRWGTETVDVLVPLQPDPTASRGDRQLNVIGRLAEGMTIGRAQDELSGIAAELARQYPDADNGWSVRTLSFYDWLIPASVRDSLAILLAAITLVLLIACANVANLLLARAAARQKELSIRIALGAARSRIVRQLLTESLLLALIAGAVGVAGGAATIRLLIAYGPATVPRLGETSFDLRVLLFALVVSAATALVFGMAPAVLASRQSPAATIQQAAAGATSTGRQRLRSVMTVVEVALSVVLLIGAGLLLRSVWRLQQVDPGFNASPLMTVRVGLPSSTYQDNQARGAFYERLLAEVRALPGIEGAAASSGLPLAGCCNTSTEFQVPGAETRAGGQASAGWRLVSPGYFAAMGIPLRGKELSWRDRGNPPPTIIISEAMARQYWPNQDPIGRTVTLDTFSASGGNRPRTIIGVAGDVRHAGLDAEPQPLVYYSTVERGAFGGMGVVWRSSVDPASHVAAVRDLVRRIDPMVLLFDVQSLDDLVANSFAPRRFDMYLFGAFAGVALLLAAIGLFGLTSYNVSQRIREIGLRRALGAEPRDILRLILGRGVALAAAGAAIGVCAAFGLTRLMQSLLFSISTTDPGTFVAVPTLLVLVAVLACYIPARRATKVDPMVALRCD